MFAEDKNPDSVVGILTGYWLDRQGSIPRKGKRDLSSPQRPDRLKAVGE
jgi:hypothetical protein